jgi:hypothetical protein
MLPHICVRYSIAQNGRYFPFFANADSYYSIDLWSTRMQSLEGIDSPYRHAPPPPPPTDKHITNHPFFILRSLLRYSPRGYCHLTRAWPWRENGWPGPPALRPPTTSGPGRRREKTVPARLWRAGTAGRMVQKHTTSGLRKKADTAWLSVNGDGPWGREVASEKTGSHIFCRFWFFWCHILIIVRSKRQNIKDK